MTAKEVDRLAKKWREGSLSAADREKFEQWYQSFDDTRLEIDSDEGESAMQSRIYHKIAAMGAIVDRQPNATSRAGRWWYVAAAASLLLAFLFYWSRQNAFSDKPWVAHRNVRAGDTIRQEILPDGSIIWLKPGATLHYVKAFKHRNVILTGEALFEVAKRAGRPFRVQVGDYVTTVLGTSFNIRQADNNKDMEVVVLTGKVAVRKQPDRESNSVEDSPEIVLLPNQRLKTDGDLLLSDVPRVEHIELYHDNQYTQGTTYNMWFDDTPFQEVARRISMKFGVDLEAEDDRYNGCRIRANLNDQSLKYTVELVAATLGGAEYKIEQNKIVLKGGGCL